MATATAVNIIPVGTSLSPYEQEWERLYRISSNEPSTSFEWTSALLQNHVESGDRVYLVRLVRDEEVIALVPLVVRRTRVLSCPVTLLFPLTERYNTHGDLLASVWDEAMVRALVGALFQLPVRWDLFRLSNVLEDHPLLRSIGRALPPRRLAWCALRSGYASYFLDLPASFEDYLRQRTSKFRNHLRRTVRNIETVASARILIFTSPDDVDRAYRMLLEVEQASWKHDHGSAITAVSRQTGFFETVCRGAAVRGHLHLQLLVIEDRPVAYNLGFLREGCYFYLKTSYAVEHRALGVATYLRARLIEELIERRIRGFDFPAEPYEWERHWAERVRWHKVVTIHRGTPAGIVVAMADRIRHRSTARAVQYVDPRASRPGGAG